MTENQQFTLYYANNTTLTSNDDEPKQDAETPSEGTIKYLKNVLQKKLIEDYNIHKALQQALNIISHQQKQLGEQAKAIERLQYQLQFITLSVQRKEVKNIQMSQNFCLDVQKQNLQLKTQLTKANQELLSKKHIPNTQKEENTLEPTSFLKDKRDNKMLKSTMRSSTKRQTRQLNIDEIYKKSLNSQQEHQDFLQNQTDFVFFRILLDIDATDNDIIRMFGENLHYMRLKSLLSKKEEKLFQFFTSISEKEFGSLLDSLRYLLSMLEVLLESILKLKRLVKAVWIIQQSLLLQETFAKMVEETCKIFPCDRVSVFLYDNKKGELWSRGAIGTPTIKIPTSKGIAGFVASTGESVNILDAHKDNRFNPEMDKRYNYRTKSVLCMPIMDFEQKSVVGVIQAINKLGKQKDFFTKDDEGLMSILVRMASTIFRNSLFHDSKMVVQNQLRQLVYATIKLSACRTMKSLITTAEDSLYKLFDIQQSKLYLYDSKEMYLFRYDNDELVKFNTNVGIVGEVFHSEKAISTLNPFNHPQFNMMIDLNTKLPILCLPIKDQDNRTVGVLQSIDSKGIENLLYQQEKHYQVNSPFFETLKNYCQLFVQVMWLVIAAEEHQEQHQIQ